MYDIIPCDDREDWLEKRTAGIGASEMAAVMGLSKWRSAYELCLEKMGEIPPVDLSDVEAIEWGHKLEPIIIQTFGERTGRLVRSSGLLFRSREHPWAQCTLDAQMAERVPFVLVDGRAERPIWQPLEAKTHSAYQIADWADGAPEPYFIQVQHQLLVTGASRGAIACLIGGARFVWQDIPRDEQMIRRIIWHGERFWQRVIDRDPPEPDGSESAARAIARRYPEDDGSEVVLSEDLACYADEIVRLRAEARTTEAALRASEARIRLAMGAAERGHLADYQITLRTQERAGFVKVTPHGDLQDCATALNRQHLVAQVVQPSTFRPMRIKRHG